MTGFGWGSAMLASTGLATFAYPYTGSRNREQIGIFEKNVGGSANQAVGRLTSSPGIFEGIQPFDRDLRRGTGSLH